MISSVSQLKLRITICYLLTICSKYASKPDICCGSERGLCQHRMTASRSVALFEGVGNSGKIHVQNAKFEYDHMKINIYSMIRGGGYHYD
ncbi:hypothetical protein Y032_0140g2183 [Ancylostoma ceylanicum]|uniref:Uncharacterized protein n=1 Tax=Ancylostoma ceylanicum TaxID=53326 RepID=A0A016T4F1_9BILA|nr:hypothetical protein Y032_0140g2183 [Ancylostoma ceylanicum]